MLPHAHDKVMSDGVQSSAPSPVHTKQSDDISSTTTAAAPERRRRIIRRMCGGSSATGSRSNPNDIPESILLNKALQEAIRSSLPKDYEFEIPKTLWKIEQVNASHVALQMPEGLLMYGCILSDILKRFSTSLRRVTILGDVTYGACCIDDLGAKALGADLLVHYGHSCLVPINKTVIPCLYVFVEIHIDTQHLVDCVCQTFEEGTNIELMGTIQVSCPCISSS
jgi:2-(3-amino-3-carboxypropyl)histidine synthase